MAARTFLCFATLFFYCECSPITNPLLPDSTGLDKVIPDYFDSKRSKPYHNSAPIELEDIPFVRQYNIDPICSSKSMEFKLRWSSTVGSSVMAHPVIFPGGADGKKQIFLSTLFDYVELLGYDGFKPWGWPISFEGSSFQGSPMLYDIDGDGKNDVGVVDKNGNMYWIRIGEFGQYLEDYHIQVPKLKIVRDWAKNLDPNFVDNYVLTSMFDHRHGGIGSEADGMDMFKKDMEKKSNAKTDVLTAVIRREKPTRPTKTHIDSRRRLTEATTGGDSSPDQTAEMQEVENPRLDSESEGLKELDEGHIGDDYVARDHAAEHIYSERNHIFDDGYRYYGHGMYNESNFVFVDAHVLGSPTLADVNGDGHVEVLVAVSYFFDRSEYRGKQLDFDPSMYVASGLACFDLQSQEWAWMVHLDLTTDKSKFKAVTYGTPTVADLDGDGRSEVILGTSLGLLYVLDGDTGFVKRYFPMQFNQIIAQIAVADIRGGPDLEIIFGDLGGNLVVVDGQGDVVWDKLLNGELLHTPTIADIDGDGQLDVVVVAIGALTGNSHIWALKGDTGEVLPGFPIALPIGATVSSSVLIADLHNYGSGLHTRMTPARYADPNLPPWTHESAGHQPAPAPTLDVNFDLEPNEENDRDSSRSKAGTISEVKNQTNPSATQKFGFGLHLIVPSLDGHIFIVDAITKCSLRLDVGEQLYSMPTLDDITGDGYLDMLVGTMNGQVLLFETSVPYHPLNAWPSFPRGRFNVFAHGQQGISVPLIEKHKLMKADIHSSQFYYEGKELSIVFDIWDTRASAKDSSSGLTDVPLKYTVILTRGTNKMEILAQAEYDHPGRYAISIPINPPESMMVVVGMYNEHGQYYEDIVMVAVGTRFYVWIKYMVAAPALLLCLPLLLLRKHNSK